MPQRKRSVHTQLHMEARKMVQRALLAAMLVLVVGIFSYADAAVLCANPSGSLAVRAASFKAGEIVVDPIALGLVGPKGADGVSGWELKTSGQINVPPGEFGGDLVNCTAGKRPIGGGFTVSSVGGRWTVVQSAPHFNPE